MSKNGDILNKTWTLIQEENMLLDEEPFDNFQSKDASNLMMASFNFEGDSSACYRKGGDRIELSIRSSFSPSFSIKDDINCSVNATLMTKVSNDFENFLSIVEKVKYRPYEESIAGIEFEDELILEPSTEFKKPAINNLTVNLGDEPMELGDGSVISSPASINDKLNNKENIIFQNGMIELDPISFNSTINPKSFDHFLNDIKQSSNKNFKLPLDQEARYDFGYLSSSMKIMTSSIDKDLNKDANFHFRKLNKINQIQSSMSSLTSLSNLPVTSSDFQINELKTSSPFKSGQKINRSYTIDQIDNIDSDVVRLNNFNSNEFVSDNYDSSSKSSQDEIANRFPKFDFDNQSEPRTVFNTTYTSWSTNEDQILIEKPNVLNKTQDLNNNESEKKIDLNVTVDIITENEDIGNEMEQKKDVMNLTQEIVVDSSKSKKLKNQDITKPFVNQIASNAKRTSINPTGKINQQIVRPTVKIVENKQISPPKTITALPEFKQPEVPPLKTNVPILTKQLEKPKSGIPRMNFTKNSQGSQVPTNSSTSILSNLKAMTKSSPPNPPASSRPSSSYLASSSSRPLSGHSASSSSLKENKKSPINQKSISIKSTEFTNMTNNIVNNGLVPSGPKLKLTSTQCPNLTSLAQSNAVLAPSNFLVKPSVSKTNSGILADQKIVNKNPSTSSTLIPSFKSTSSAIPTFRNATNNPSLRVNKLIK